MTHSKMEAQLVLQDDVNGTKGVLYVHDLEQMSYYKLGGKKGRGAKLDFAALLCSALL